METPIFISHQGLWWPDPEKKDTRDAYQKSIQAGFGFSVDTPPPDYRSVDFQFTELPIITSLTPPEIIVSPEVQGEILDLKTLAEWGGRVVVTDVPHLLQALAANDPNLYPPEDAWWLKEDPKLTPLDDSGTGNFEEAQ